jgi:hypothetical protein
METPVEQQKRPFAPTESTADDMVKLVRKLRWMGMDDEAEQLLRELRAKEPADCVLAAPRDTD